MIFTLISTKIKLLLFRLFFLSFSVTMMMFSMNHTVWILYDDAFPKEGFSKRFWCYTISESECAKILPDCLDSRIQFGKISKKVGIWWRMLETIRIDDNMFIEKVTNHQQKSRAKHWSQPPLKDKIAFWFFYFSNSKIFENFLSFLLS